MKTESCNPSVGKRPPCATFVSVLLLFSFSRSTRVVFRPSCYLFFFVVVVSFIILYEKKTIISLGQRTLSSINCRVVFQSSLKLAEDGLEKLEAFMFLIAFYADNLKEIDAHSICVHDNTHILNVAT